MKLATKLTILSLIVLLSAPMARADWDIGDPHKWAQLPDLSLFGMDVQATAPKVLADDFLCVTTEKITDIHIWGSWKYNEVDPDPLFKLSIHRDVLASTGTPYSTPGRELWSRVLPPTAIRQVDNQLEYWYDPNTGEYEINHNGAFQYNFIIPESEAFEQLGTDTNSVVYWLDVSYVPLTTNYEFGWKTSIDHWNDHAVVGHLDGFLKPLGDWVDLWHPADEVPLDMAFVITPEPMTLSVMALGGLAVLIRRQRRKRTK